MKNYCRIHDKRSPWRLPILRVRGRKGLPADVFYLSINQFGGDGFGHRKIGDLGRAHWENAAFAVGADFKLN